MVNLFMKEYNDYLISIKGIKMITYKNWDFEVSILSDWTKIRSWSWNPIYPESLDLKITNFCDKGCIYCHEQSSIDWQHWNIDLIKSIFYGTEIKGIEIAIWGGNPLAHPQLLDLLYYLKQNWFIANITVNSFHLEKYKEFLTKLINEKLIYWLWISYDSIFKSSILEFLQYEHCVIHMIAGWNTIKEIEELYNLNNKVKVLILWFKNYWKGICLYAKMKEKITQYKKELRSIIRKEGITLAFDNLAIIQLEIRRFFTTNEWNQFYMGDDWKFTMFIDLPNEKYTKSSTSIERYDLKGNLKDIFWKILKQS